MPGSSSPEDSLLRRSCRKIRGARTRRHRHRAAGTMSRRPSSRAASRVAAIGDLESERETVKYEPEPVPRNAVLSGLRTETNAIDIRREGLGLAAARSRESLTGSLVPEAGPHQSEWSAETPAGAARQTNAAIAAPSPLSARRIRCPATAGHAERNSAAQPGGPAPGCLATAATQRGCTAAPCRGRLRACLGGRHAACAGDTRVHRAD